MQSTQFDIEIRAIDSIRPYENNPRKNDSAVDAVAAIDQTAHRGARRQEGADEILDHRSDHACRPMRDPAICATIPVSSRNSAPPNSSGTSACISNALQPKSFRYTDINT